MLCRPYSFRFFSFAPFAVVQAMAAEKNAKSANDEQIIRQLMQEWAEGTWPRHPDRWSRHPTTPRLPHFGGKYEDDPLSGVGTGTRALRPCGCAGEGRPSRDVEVRVPDWRAEADVHTDDQDGRGQARRDDELA